MVMLYPGAYKRVNIKIVLDTVIYSAGCAAANDISVLCLTV